MANVAGVVCIYTWPSTTTALSGHHHDVCSQSLLGLAGVVRGAGGWPRTVTSTTWIGASSPIPGPPLSLRRESGHRSGPERRRQQWNRDDTEVPVLWQKIQMSLCKYTLTHRVTAT